MQVFLQKNKKRSPKAPIRLVQLSAERRTLRRKPARGKH